MPIDSHDFTWPSDVSVKTKYRLIGNSVNVDVVRNLIDYLFEGDEVNQKDRVENMRGLKSREGEYSNVGVGIELE